MNHGRGYVFSLRGKGRLNRSTTRDCRDLHKLAVELVRRRHSACHALRWVDSLEEGLEAAFCNHVALIGEGGVSI